MSVVAGELLTTRVPVPVRTRSLGERVLSGRAKYRACNYGRRSAEGLNVSKYEWLPKRAFSVTARENGIFGLAQTGKCQVVVLDEREQDIQAYVMAGGNVSDRQIQLWRKGEEPSVRRNRIPIHPSLSTYMFINAEKIMISNSKGENSSHRLSVVIVNEPSTIDTIRKYYYGCFGSMIERNLEFVCFIFEPDENGEWNLVSVTDNLNHLWDQR